MREDLKALIFCLAVMLTVFFVAFAATEEGHDSVKSDEIRSHTEERISNPKAPDKPSVPGNANRINGCTVTYYCCERYPHICGTGDGITATGTEVTPGRTVAVDPAVIPYGSNVAVDYGDGELHFYIAEDTGGAVSGGHIDVAVAKHQEALDMGVRSATVFWW